MMTLRTVPIQKWPGELREDHERKTTPFKKDSSHGYKEQGVDWPGTMDLLESELDKLEADGAVLQMAITRSDLKVDGTIKALARPAHPGVILSFGSKYGPLSYPCDAFLDWRANVRAIAIALENLRRIDRYGVSRRGEQYTGWGQLPPAGGSSVTMTATGAAALLKKESGVDFAIETILNDVAAAIFAHKAARRRAHPDAGGSDERFQRVEIAWAILSSHHEVS